MAEPRAVRPLRRDDDQQAAGRLHDLAGRPTRVIQQFAGEEDENGPWFRGTDLYYDTSGHVWLTRLMRWQLEQVGDPPLTQINLDPLEFLAAMEYRYDGGRRRYMVRPRNPETLAPPTDGQGNYNYHEAAWHDYSGASIYGDYAVTVTRDANGDVIDAAFTERTAHEPGVVQYDYAAAPGDRQQLVHGNLVGTTERMTDASGAITHRAVYTAFGELVYPAPGAQPPSAVNTRYGYVGAWGYQAASWDSAAGNCVSNDPAQDPVDWSQRLVPGSGPTSNCLSPTSLPCCDPLALLGWLHVGERYYDPASGRFAQRDPIGIRGGYNVYDYVQNNPALGIDPEGLWPYEYDLARGSAEGVFLTFE